MENRNESLRNEVLATEAELAKCRDRLSRHKRVRDKLRRENVELQRKCGLIGKDALLRDFERQRDTSDEYKARLAKLKEMHAEMSTRATVYQRKLERLQQQRPTLYSASRGTPGTATDSVYDSGFAA